MDSCEDSAKSGRELGGSEEEVDSCGELPVGGGGQTTMSGVNVHRRCSEFYPPGSTSRGMPAAGAAIQARRDRRQSDPGRIAVPLLRVSLHGDSTNGDRCLQPGVRLSDPRLDAIRSLLASGPCEVGEALPAAAPSSSPPSLRRAGLPLRSKSPTADAAGKSRQARYDSRRLSLPTPAPLSPPLWPRRASGSSGPGGSWLPEEMGEAMGAVSGTPTGEFPTGSPPPRPSPITAASDQATSGGAALRRRRSVSLDHSSRLEAISEENAARKAEQLKSVE